jgi:glucose/arabinose dehydrogenase
MHAPPHVTSRSLFVLLGCLATLVLTPATPAATLPTGFAETQVATGLAAPTAMAFAPDGRLFVTLQGGSLRVIKNGTLLATPFLTVSVNSAGERGLLGVAFDPSFAVNQYVYVYYTTASAPIHNRVSRFTANGDVAVPGSEVVILELENLSSATNHNGGALHFGPDGTLYVAVGDNANGANAQTLGNRLGKMLRLNPDGSIPTTNPFYGTATGANRAIWAIGLRNPYTFAFQGGTSRMFINDVGQNTWEEINDGIAGSNYGWPDTEGATSDPRFRSPIFSYGHGSSATTGCAITGAAFYNPATTQFPSSYVGDYFFADYCSGWIRNLDPSAENTVTGFATGIASPVDLAVASDGSLYYLARGSGGAVFRVAYAASQAPTITTHPASQTVPAGGTATFTVAASGSPPLSYQWQRNGADIQGATSASYSLASVTTADSGARFRARVTNSAGSALSNEATLTVTSNQPPAASISDPPAGTLYSAGQTITYAGSGSDPEDGALPASTFTWQVDFHHAQHVHPFVAPTSGSTSGSFVVPTVGHTEPDVWYRIILTVRDSGGLTSTVVRDIHPRTVQLTLATSPAGLTLRLDDQPRATPLTVTGVVGVQRALEAPSPQTVGGVTYEFVSWSDGGARAHTISTPSSSTTYTATYRVVPAGTGGLTATYYDNVDLTGATVTRVDPTVDFTWGTGGPAAGIAADTFSARWVGTVQPAATGTYTFFTESDDGVRLWVNGQQLVSNWTDHSRTENSGTISLTAGVRYAIRMEFYERGGDAVARLLWSGPSTAKAPVPQSALDPRFGARINFQPSGAAVPAGYLPDTGAVYGLRTGGERFGWNASNTAQTRDRNASNSPDQRYDTLTHLQKPANPNAVWEIALPNGTYTVRIVAGDAAHFDSVFRLNVEGALVLSGTPSSSTRWFDATASVTVADGRLTISNGAGASNNKICFVEIS